MIGSFLILGPVQLTQLTIVNTAMMMSIFPRFFPSGAVFPGGGLGLASSLSFCVTLQACPGEQVLVAYSWLSIMPAKKPIRLFACCK